MLSRNCSFEGTVIVQKPHGFHVRPVYLSAFLLIVEESRDIPIIKRRNISGLVFIIERRVQWWFGYWQAVGHFGCAVGFEPG